MCSVFCLGFVVVVDGYVSCGWGGLFFLCIWKWEGLDVFFCFVFGWVIIGKCLFFFEVLVFCKLKDLVFFFRRRGRVIGLLGGVLYFFRMVFNIF